jgi:hypothetical protein
MSEQNPPAPVDPPKPPDPPADPPKPPDPPTTDDPKVDTIVEKVLAKLGENRVPRPGAFGSRADAEADAKRMVEEAAAKVHKEKEDADLLGWVKGKKESEVAPKAQTRLNRLIWGKE